MNRIQYVDRLRGLAVVVMFFVHTASAWITPDERTSVYWDVAMTISGMVAPIFMFLAGVSVALIAKSGRQRGLDEGGLKKRIARRGIEIVLIGYALHLSFYVLGGFWGPWDRVLKVDVLHCIGLSLALMPWVAWPRGRFNWPALALFAGLPLVGMVTYRLPLEDWLPQGAAAYLATGTRLALFPLVPYGAWIALGLVVGSSWTNWARDPGSDRRFWYGLAIAAPLVWAVGKGFKLIYFNYPLHHLGVDVEQTRGLAYMFWMKTCFVLWLFALARATASLFGDNPKGPLLLFGRTSLFAYCAHLLIIYPGMERFVSRSLSPAAHLALATLLAFTMYFLTRLWRRLIPR